MCSVQLWLIFPKINLWANLPAMFSFGFPLVMSSMGKIAAFFCLNLHSNPPQLWTKYSTSSILFSFSMYALCVTQFCACRTRNHRPIRAGVKMMPIGTPRVPYRTPGEGTWQWVDLWNALVSWSRLIFCIYCSLGLLPQAEESTQQGLDNL